MFFDVRKISGEEKKKNVSLIGGGMAGRETETGRLSDYLHLLHTCKIDSESIKSEVGILVNIKFSCNSLKTVYQISNFS